MFRTSTKPLLGVTMGDPCGIGPELILRLLRSRRALAAARYAVFGSKGVLEKVGRRLRLPMPRLEAAGAEDALRGGRRAVLIDTVPCPQRLALMGKPTAAGGRVAVRWIDLAIVSAVGGRIDGMVTAPISKEAVRKGGGGWPGHTEMLAERTGVKKPVMMMIGGTLRVALVTTHAAIRDVPRLVTKANVLETLRVTHYALRRCFGLRRPRLCVCGLNPHAGEAGQFGREDIRAIAPAVAQAVAEGIRCEGPLPADVVFTRRAMARYDAAVAMFHDQANIPVKLLAFEKGVNVTLGLPIIRTSPAHGTAFDIVKRGVADVGSMVEAACTAARMARARGAHLRRHKP